jgi:hypothetical protein
MRREGSPGGCRGGGSGEVEWWRNSGGSRWHLRRVGEAPGRSHGQGLARRRGRRLPLMKFNGGSPDGPWARMMADSC